MARNSKKIEPDYIDEDDLEIEDPEMYRSSKIEFSHESDVAKSIGRVQHAGSQELRAGWWDIKKDKQGNLASQKYNKDTREDYIESVNSFKSILIAEINSDKDFKGKVGEIMVKKDECYTKWAEKEHEWVSSMPSAIKKNMEHFEGTLNEKYPFQGYYMKELIKLSRKLEETLHLLIAKLKYFKVEDAFN